MALVRYSSLYGPEGERGLITPPAGGGTMRCSYGTFETEAADNNNDHIVLCPLPTRAIILDVKFRSHAAVTGATDWSLELRNRELDGGAVRYQDINRGAINFSTGAEHNFLTANTDFNPYVSHFGEQLWQYPAGAVGGAVLDAVLDVDPVEIWNLCIGMKVAGSAAVTIGWQLYWSDGS